MTLGTSEVLIVGQPPTTAPQGTGIDFTVGDLREQSASLLPLNWAELIRLLALLPPLYQISGDPSENTELDLYLKSLMTALIALLLAGGIFIEFLFSTAAEYRLANQEYEQAQASLEKLLQLWNETSPTLEEWLRILEANQTTSTNIQQLRVAIEDIGKKITQLNEWLEKVENPKTLVWLRDIRDWRNEMQQFLGQIKEYHSNLQEIIALSQND